MTVCQPCFLVAMETLCFHQRADFDYALQVAKLRIVPSSMSALGGKPAWLRPEEVLFLDDAVAR